MLSNENKKMILFFSVLFALLSLPLLAKAQINHSPVITSTPTISIIAGESYLYTVKASDQDNDSLSFSLSSSPANMTLSQEGVIKWQETKAGLYNAVIEVSDQKGGYTSQTFQIQVVPATASTIIITPNDRPTLVVSARTQQFQAKAFDRYNNELTDVTFEWSCDEKIGTINQSGLFTAKQGGIGSVAAEKDDVKTSVGVIVKDAVTTVANANVNKEAEKPKEEVKEETKTKSSEQKITNTNQEVLTPILPVKQEERKEEATTASCHNWPHWIIIVLLIIYGLILAIYYFFIKRYRLQRVRGWWIIPIFLTAIGEIMYFKYFCQGTYLWWPWVLLAIGVVLTAYYWWISRKKIDYTQSELPF